MCSSLPSGDNGVVNPFRRDRANKPERPIAGAAAPVSVLGLVWRFTMAGLIALSAVAIIMAVYSRHVGTDRAILDARRVATLTGRGIVEPALQNAIVDFDPAAVAAVDTVVHRSVLQDSLIRVKIWRADGTIVYSDEPQLIGRVFDIDDAQLDVLVNNGIEAEVSSLDKPENLLEAVEGELLEVYLPIQTPSGETLLYEAYFRYDGVIEAGREWWLSFAPVTLGSLVVLELIQIPLAWSLAKRLRRGQQERERLLHQAIESSETERRRIASELHDGVVQDLSGVSFTLAAAARRNGEADGVLTQSSQHLRDTIQSLRSMLVDIYPPNLQEEGIEAALSDLLARLRSRGVTTELDTDMGVVRPSPPSTALLYRVAQEALRNVAGHSQATRVAVNVRGGAGLVTMTIDDDGRGFDPADAETARQEGHFGLRLMGDLVAEAGGELRVSSAPGQGTNVEVRIPA